MPDLPQIPKTEILVIGAGVLGLCTAVELTRRGHQVRVVDPGQRNASAVAAGMIAPALEAVLDEVTTERAALFADARKAWDGFAAQAGVTIHPAQTVWAGGEGRAIAEAAAALGFEVRGTGDAERPGLPSDVLIEPGPALAAMEKALAHPVIHDRAVAVDRSGDGWRVLTEAGVLEARTVVLATGAAEGLKGLPRDAAALMAQISPIRGQIGFIAGARTDAVVRGRGLYVAPSGKGAVVGATMEAGRRDLEPDAEAGRRLVAGGEGLIGRSIEGEIDWRVGIRGSTPDGLPMAGASGDEGLFMALAPRRNGWLLGALVAQVVADAVEGGGAGSPHAAALDPRRFLSPSR